MSQISAVVAGPEIPYSDKVLSAIAFMRALPLPYSAMCDMEGTIQAIQLGRYVLCSFFLFFSPRPPGAYPCVHIIGTNSAYLQTPDKQ